MRAGGILVPPRSHEAERLDRPDNPPADLRRALGDIRSVNRFLGGRRALATALRPFLLETDPARALSVLDAGTGSADLPVAIVRLAERLGRQVRVIAIDLDPETTRIARAFTRGLDQIDVVRADAFAMPFGPRSFDVVTTSMFLHHFPHGDVVRLLAEFSGLARRAVIVNDLRRHRLPWLAIHLLARAAGRHPMFVHDAPLSVLRGFTPDELCRAAREAGCRDPRLRRAWPFRLVLTLPAGGAA